MLGSFRFLESGLTFFNFSGVSCRVRPAFVGYSSIESSSPTEFLLLLLAQF